MCLIPGIADGRYLIDEELISPEDVVDCGYGRHGHDQQESDGVTRRGALQRTAATTLGLALAGMAGPAAALAQGGPKATAATATIDPTAPAQIVFLGTAGGPVLGARSQPAHALVVNGIAYLVDGGADVIFQLAKAGIPLPSVRHLFITHLHSDHVAGYPMLALLGRVQAAALNRLDVWGPTAATMHRHLHALFQGDISSRQRETSRYNQVLTPFDEVIFGHDITIKRDDFRIRPVFEDANVKVSAVRVVHGPYPDMPFPYAYRFDIKSGASAGKSVVFSGDTEPVDSLIALAQDCDVLVHEAVYVPAVDQIVQSVDPSRRNGLRDLIVAIHTDVAEIPRIAKSARAKRVFLTHITPAFIPPPVFLATAQEAAARIGYSLDLTVAADLDVVNP